jgi:hypothetical protein
MQQATASRLASVRRLAILSALAALPLTTEAQLVTGLLGASGSTVGPDGALYVTEGAVGKVSRVDPDTGEVTPFAEGLPPAVIPIGGAIDVVFIGNTAYVLVTLVSFAGNIDGIYRVDGPTSFTVIADLGGFSAANPPVTPFDLPNGLQYAIEAYRGGFLVTDGHHNRVLYVTRAGEVSEFMTFDNIVPTGLEVHGQRVLMAEAGPSPHDPEDGKIISIDHSGVDEIASGAPLLVDVERGRGVTLFALSQGSWSGEMPGDPADPFTGSLLRVLDDGSFGVIADGINLPTSLEIIGNTGYVVTLAGEIWRYHELASPPYGAGTSRGNQ